VWVNLMVTRSMTSRYRYGRAALCASEEVAVSAFLVEVKMTDCLKILSLR